MPAPSPQLALTFAPDAAGVTRLVRRRVRYPYAFLKPFWFGDRPEGIATAILQSGSGGLFGGERLAQAITLQASAAAHVTTQAAAIAHAARDRPATRQDVTLTLAAGSYLEYLPEPVLLFPGSALVQRIDAAVAPDALLLLGDGIVHHDPAGHGQPFERHASVLEVRRSDGRLLFTDRTAITGIGFDRSLRGAGRAWPACGWLAIVAPDQARHPRLAAGLTEAMRELAVLRAEGRLLAAFAELPNRAGFWCRMLAADGSVLRGAMRCLWRQGRVAATGLPPPRDRK